MNTVTKAAPLGTLGLSSGHHWVRFHVEGDSISFEVAGSVEDKSYPANGMQRPTGFVQKWGGSIQKVGDPSDAWLTHINEKHLR